MDSQYMYDQIKAIVPSFINGKTYEHLEEEEKLCHAKGIFYYVDEITMSWMAPSSNLEAMKSFEVRDDDVFIFTYPRSGTHWTSEIVNYILNDGKGDFDRTFLKAGLEISPSLDPLLVNTASPGYKLYETMKSPRCIISHLPERLRPPQIKEKKPKIVYVARNPKDTQVSLFKLTENQNTGAFGRPFEEFLWSFYFGKDTFGPWFDRVLEAWRHKDDENFLFVKYEDLHKDLRGTVCKLAKHVGKDFSDDIIDSIVENATFSGMKQTYQKLEDEHGEKGKELTHFGNSPHLKQGKVGGWKNYFTVEQSATFDKVYALRMQGSDLEFDFEL